MCLGGCQEGPNTSEEVLGGVGVVLGLFTVIICFPVVWHRNASNPFFLRQPSFARASLRRCKQNNQANFWNQMNYRHPTSPTMLPSPTTSRTVELVMEVLHLQLWRFQHVTGTPRRQEHGGVQKTELNGLKWSTGSWCLGWLFGSDMQTRTKSHACVSKHHENIRKRGVWIQPLRGEVIRGVQDYDPTPVGPGRMFSVFL